ncbi:MAG: hypothetical protein ACE5K4_12400 [Candidatus Hydrothermarchaeota archaeon]
MDPIVRKCPVCREDAIFQRESGPNFKKGYYTKIFKCVQDHLFVEKFKFTGLIALVFLIIFFYEILMARIRKMERN